MHVSMIARAQQTLFGQDLSSVSPELVFLIALVIVLVGLALAFAGRKVWRHMMSFIGAIIGGLFGFVFGAAIGGWLVGFVAGLLGSFIGSALFIFLARVGISVVAAALTVVVVGAFTDSSLVALFVGAIAFVVTFVYVETAIGLVTAVVGALLVGAGLFLMDLVDMLLVVIAVLGIAVLGAAFQMTALKEEKERRLAHHATHHPVAAAVAAPAAPPMPGRTCSICGGQLSYIPEYNRYYCYHCQRYE
jgi:MFS family permease